MARKLTVLSFISALVFSFFAFEGAFGLNEKLRENHNSDTDNFYNEVLADQHSSLLFPILACISIYLFICFGTAWLAGKLSKAPKPYRVFAVTSGTVCLGTLIAALIASVDTLKDHTIMRALSHSVFLGGWLIIILPLTALVLIADLILWDKYNKKPKISDLHKYNKEM